MNNPSPSSALSSDPSAHSARAVSRSLEDRINQILTYGLDAQIQSIGGRMFVGLLWYVSLETTNVSFGRELLNMASDDLNLPIVQIARDTESVRYRVAALSLGADLVSWTAFFFILRWLLSALWSLPKRLSGRRNRKNQEIMSQISKQIKYMRADLS